MFSLRSLLPASLRQEEQSQVGTAEPAAIEPLQAQLALLKAQPDSSATVTIMGDKDIPYRLLRKVMSTCAQAEYTDVAFAVRTRLEKVEKAT